VASRVGGVTEIIDDHVHGRLVEPDDPAMLASVMAQLLRDPEASSRYSAEFQRRVRGAFTWNRAFGRYAQLLSEE
jgi:glycosyltransferase involved in cell wall biosynthesis